MNAVFIKLLFAILGGHVMNCRLVWPTGLAPKTAGTGFGTNLTRKQVEASVKKEYKKNSTKV